ncbi:glycoside hydrolase family 13 protein [[Pseudopropionibacterium] massiliense]|uniref:glycoside hydrolase family 13 protein n=1 Tax=[Pseudopropionibacterium] massiliense TaxID=2220000 RepID=UPI00103258EE|nr:alpha-glucosidase [[Pseudopropionibacterium] massiliense]
MKLDRNATVAEVYAHPLGRDIIDKMLLQTGRSTAWVRNPLVSRLRLRQLDKILGRMFGPGFVDTLVDLLADCPESPPRLDGPIAATWWKRAVFYQIYPRSFADSNGDGIGDLPGILARLPYLDDLGIDCLWLSPIFTSPNKDMGYDIADYRSVMAEMGTIDDLRRLIAACHERGMRIILDLVVNHTSDEHPWFRDALADPEGARGDYYFLRDGDPETPPNNWTSFFSGPAWRRIGEKWVLHLFAPEQPDLNWDNPAVRREVADIVRFWLAEGVDGFRLDVINYISKRDGLPDGNATVGQVMGFTGVEHYFHGPHLHDHLAQLRREAFTRTDVEPGHEAPGADARPIMIGETPGAGVEVARLLTSSQRDELDLIFSFDHLETPGHVRWDEYAYDLNFLKRYYIDYQSRLGSDDWMSLFFENHDNPRMISKVNPDPRFRDQLGKALATILLTMRGTPFIFQGQEIGAVNQDFPDESALRDVESLNLLAAEGPGAWGKIMAGSRDHARVPMRWDRDEHWGFTRGTPWIKAFDDSVGYSVAAQEHNPDSVLRYYRRLIWLRRSNPTLSLGSIRFIDADVKDYFAWFREHNGERWFIEVNLSGHPLRRRHRDRALEIIAGTTKDRSNPMEPYEALVCQVPPATGG